MEAGKTIKSDQTGFDVTLPPREVATLLVTSVFGDSETNEGSVCRIVSGTVDAAGRSKLFVTEGSGGAR